MWVQSLGQEDPLKKEMATHSGILAWEILQTEDEMLGWHHRLNRHKFEQTPGDSEEEGSLVCCSPWGQRGRHDLVTEQQQISYTVDETRKMNFY